MDWRGAPEAHPLALPPPWDTYPPPFRVERIIRRSDDERVWRACMDSTRPRGNEAVSIGDEDVRGAGLTWRRLAELADRRVVIVSLGVLAEAINQTSARAATLRIHRQTDTPTCAMVSEASFITRGFSLHDVFRYGWREAGGGAFAQRYLAKSPGLRRFCEGYGLTTVLVSEGETDYSTGHPMCLCRAGRGGFLLAIDAEPPSRWASADRLSPYVDRLVGQALGQTGVLRGQYVVAPRCRQEFAQTMAGLGDRFPPLRWVPTGVGSEPPIGWIDSSGAGGETAKDTRGRRVQIRTGFAADEWDLVMGVAMLLKQSVRAGWGQRRPVAVQWIPIARRSAAPPPTGPKEFTYVIAVPPDLRRRMERPASPDVRIDVKRARGPEIVVRTPTAGRALTARLAMLSSSLGVAIRVEKAARAAGSVRNWDAAFPVEREAGSFDAITAAERVILVVEAVLHTCV